MLSSSVCVYECMCYHCLILLSRFIDTLIPILFLLGSLTFIVQAWLRSRRSFHSAVYAPLKQHVTSYGTTPSLEEDEDDTPSSSTIASEELYDVPLNRWSIYNITRLAGTLLQLGISAAVLRALLAHDYTLDTTVEGSSSNVLTSSMADCVYWVSGSGWHTKDKRTHGVY